MSDKAENWKKFQQGFNKKLGSDPGVGDWLSKYATKVKDVAKDALGPEMEQSDMLRIPKGLKKK